MRRFDGVDNTLANNLEAKNRAVELIGSHRCLAALSRDFKENQCWKNGQSGCGRQKRPQIFKLLTASRGSQANQTLAKIARLYWLNLLGSRPLDTQFGR